MKKLANKTGQSVMEYFIILTVVLTAVLATGFIDRVRGVFNTYFEAAVAEIATVSD